MILVDEVFSNCINSSVRNIKGRVELFEGSTLIQTFNPTDALKSYTVERAGVGNKFFGYGICQKLTVKLIDKDRQINIGNHHSLEALMGTTCNYTYTYPIFYVQDVSRDESSNELTVVGYDALYKMNTITIADLGLEAPYTLEMFAATGAAALGLPLNHTELPSDFDLLYPQGANFDGTETLREAFDALAEATQTIYYINHDWEVTFKRLDISGEPVLTIDKSKYFSMKSNGTCVLSQICHTTELGDNIIAGSEGGYIQYIRDNPFWVNRDDVADLVTTAATNIAGLSINQFDCSWRGNYLLEIGDKIALITKDNETIHTYLTNDSITYSGAMNEKSQWAYSEGKTETAATPATLGDALKHTYAKVDKVNKQIELVVSEVDANKGNIAQIIIDNNTILNSVEETNKRIDDQGNVIDEITKKVETQITPEEMTIAIQTEIANGVDKVTTTTGFTFDEVGLTVSKTGSEMTTTITEDGMRVYRDDQEVLTADNTGVKAENLHATTYLIIGKNSRFEDYEGTRTGCFWIGG